MSVKALHWVFQVPIPPITKVVLLAIADHADDQGRCWPGLELIAKKASVHERTVMRHIDDLERMGILTKAKRRDPSGTQTSNAYTIHLDKPPSDFLSLGFQPGDSDRVTPVSPKPSGLEPSESSEAREVGRAAADGSDGSSGTPPTSPRQSLVMQALEKNYARLFRDVTPLALESLQTWADAHPTADPASITAGFRAAEMKGARSWKYVAAVLSDYIKPVEEAQAEFNAPALAQKYRHQCGPMCKNGCIMQEAV